MPCEEKYMTQTRLFLANALDDVKEVVHKKLSIGATVTISPKLPKVTASREKVDSSLKCNFEKQTNLT